MKGLRNDYLEDPVYGLNGMRRTREMVRVPLATNTVVVNFEQLAANVLNTAVDVILLDTTFWGGIRACVKAAAVCETFQLGVAVHSSGELGIQLATMLHLGAVIPNLSFAADAHYHHLTDDIIEGGLMQYQNGSIAVPTTPGLGVKLDRYKVEQYSELYRRLGGYPYDQDPGRPGWTPSCLTIAGPIPGLIKATRARSGFHTRCPILSISTNRVAVVIGGTSGIGRAIALGLAGQGADVVPTGRRGKSDGRGLRSRLKHWAAARCARSWIFATGHRSTPCATKPSNISRRVDILVNAAGFTFKQPTSQICEEQMVAPDRHQSHRRPPRLPVFLRPLKA